MATSGSHAGRTGKGARHPKRRRIRPAGLSRGPIMTLHALYHSATVEQAAFPSYQQKPFNFMNGITWRADKWPIQQRAQHGVRNSFYPYQATCCRTSCCAWKTVRTSSGWQFRRAFQVARIPDQSKAFGHGCSAFAPPCISSAGAWTLEMPLCLGLRDPGSFDKTPC
jgi:hypothetical protein